MVAGGGVLELTQHDSLTGIGPMVGWRWVIGGLAFMALGWIGMRNDPS